MEIMPTARHFISSQKNFKLTPSESLTRIKYTTIVNMKSFLAPLVLCLIIASNSVFSAVNDFTSNETPPRAQLSSSQQHSSSLAVSAHCVEHSFAALKSIKHLKTLPAHAPHSGKMDCEKSQKCCLKNCFQQFHLNLNDLTAPPPRLYSYTVLTHYFALVQGITRSIERPPKA